MRIGLPKKRHWILKGMAWAKMKRLVYDRAGRLCECCRMREAVDAHHIIFRSEHRDDRETNLIALCRSCHDHHAHGCNKHFWQAEFLKYVRTDPGVLAWRKAHELELARLYEKARK